MTLFPDSFQAQEREQASEIERQEHRAREIAEKLRAARSRDPRLRSAAARRLGELGAGADVLLELLGDPNGWVRAAAAEGLGDLRPEELIAGTFEALLAAIDDPFDRVTSSAIGALGRLGVEAAREEILPCLADSNPYIVAASLVALGRLGPASLGETITPFLKHELEFVRSAAIRALSLLRWEPAGSQLFHELAALLESGQVHGHENLLKNLVLAMQALKVREAIPALIEIAQNQVGLRSAAVQALTSLDAGTAAPALARLLGDPSLSLRKSLIRLVIESGYAAAAPVLRPLLADPNVEIRRLALGALAALGDQTSLPRIQWMCFHDPNPFVRLAAIDSLVAMLGPGCLPDLISLTGDPNASVRKSAAQHLGGFRPLSPETRAALQRLTQDLFAEVSETARQSLATSLEKGVTDPATPLQPAPPKSPSLLPAAIRPQAADLLRLLRTWQNELPELLRSTSLEEISETDRALARLIGQLENDEKREP